MDLVDPKQKFLAQEKFNLPLNLKWLIIQEKKTI